MKQWTQRTLNEFKDNNLAVQILYQKNMTEVSVLRIQSAGQIHPLEDDKNSHIYIPKQHYDPRLTNSASANSPRKFRDIKDGFQQAALINIVASVNSDNQQRPSTTSDTSKNTMNCLSGLFVHRDRQISIPKPQVFVEAPQKFTKKKPLFNKKSGHQATEHEMEHRKRTISLSRGRPQSRDPGPAPKQESIKIAVSLQKVTDENNNDGSRDWISSPSKVRQARSNSPRHRFASLKKKPEQRATTSIPTCEAIDILDATESFAQSKSTLPSRDESVVSPSQDLYRAKSLPALFPVKRRKSAEVQNVINIEKKNSSHPFKKSSVKAFGGMPNLLVGKTFQGKSNEELENIDENGKLASKSTNKSNDQHTKTTNKPEKAKDNGIIFQEKENITLHGRSIPNPRPSSIQMQRYSRHPETDLLYSTYSSYEYFDDKKVVRQLDRHFEDLRKHLSAKVSNLSDGGSFVSESSSDISSYNLVGKAFKSNLSTTSSVNKNGKQRSQKRVTFAEDPEEEVVMYNKYVTNYDNDRALLNARLMQSKYQFKEKGRELPQMKPISDSELMLLKHRLLPGSIHSETKTKTDFVDNMKISGMVAPSARSSSRASDTNRSIVSEADTIGIEEAAREWNGAEIDATNRNRTEIPLSQGASSFYPTEHEDIMDSSDSDEDIDHYDSYRVVKAIDLGKLSDFQHRKFKKVPHKHDPSTTHFVKIKVK